MPVHDASSFAKINERIENPKNRKNKAT